MVAKETRRAVVHTYSRPSCFRVQVFSHTPSLCQLAPFTLSTTALSFPTLSTYHREPQPHRAEHKTSPPPQRTPLRFRDSLPAPPLQAADMSSSNNLYDPPNDYQNGGTASRTDALQKVSECFSYMNGREDGILGRRVKGRCGGRPGL